MTVLSLTWESPYLAKTVFILGGAQVPVFHISTASVISVSKNDTESLKFYVYSEQFRV